ncbi:Hypothetical predicted protein [Paramuricea clavata]|uniref:Uncharacterized protein n=1 Tax=Paramuricea clavata TaxID=317549 RepID=A0A6S7GZP8_PARCT|nr:Hypothetical predicted protein [Paramuricea clavata]
MCKLREAKFLEQQMGQLPKARLKPSPAFNHVMIDLFGPYSVRGEVQKRTSSKAYGVIFTDLVMRAVHIEAVFGDPRSQLIGAERELTETWKSIDRQSLHKSGTENGLTWIFGPADSPWYQGAVESLVKSAKRAIHFSINQ